MDKTQNQNINSGTNTEYNYKENPQKEGKIPPHSIDLEMGLLGGMMIDSSIIDTVLGILKPKHFYKTSNKLIYQVIIDLNYRREPVDLITVTEELKIKGELDAIGGPYYLTQLTENFVSPQSVEFVCNRILEYWLKRDLINITSSIQDMCFDSTTDTKALLNKAQYDILEITNALIKKPYISLAKEINSTMEYVEALHEKKEEMIGVPSGYLELDKLTGGFQKSELIVIAGRPSHGKTALALSIARNAAVKYGKSIGIFSIEMSNRELALRFICAEAKIDISRLKTGRSSVDDWNKIALNVGKLSKPVILLDDSSPLSLLEVRSKARRMKKEHNIDMIIIDYLQLMEVINARSIERHLEIAYITRGLKELSKELDIPVIALSQLSRKIEDRAGKEKRPQLSDLRESGSIEQDSDVVIFVNRPEIYMKKDDIKFNDVAGVAEIIVGKQRNGPIGEIKLTFIHNYARFEEPEKRVEPVYYTSQETPF